VLSGCTLVPPCGLRARDTKTDLTHGRSVALLAPPHPKCPFQVWLQRVRAFLTCLPSTYVLRSGRTIGTPDHTGQYGCLPIGAARYLELIEGLRLEPEIALRSSVVLVLFGSGGKGSGQPVETGECQLELVSFRFRIHGELCELYASSVVP